VTYARKMAIQRDRARKERERQRAVKRVLAMRELAELVRSAQHHVDRSWPQAQEWLERAQAVLGRSRHSDDPNLRPKFEDER